jgi:rhomboid family GlyGly-CTERM serine protease
VGLRKGQKAGRSGHWAAAATVAVISAALELGGDAARDVLAWDREQLAGGELWRLVSGHFVHLGWPHLGLNVAGLAVTAWLVGGAYDTRRWLLVLLASMTAMDAGFWFLDNDLDWYVGLSGILHGLLTAGLVAGILRRDREAAVLAVLVAAKLAWEQFAGPLPGSTAPAGGNVIVDAHLYGAAGGLLAAAALGRRVRPAASI